MLRARRPAVASLPSGQSGGVSCWLFRALSGPASSVEAHGAEPSPQGRIRHDRSGRRWMTNDPFLPRCIVPPVRFLRGSAHRLGRTQRGPSLSLHRTGPHDRPHQDPLHHHDRLPRGRQDHARAPSPPERRGSAAGGAGQRIRRLGFDGSFIEGCGISGCTEDDIVELPNGCICCTVADDFVPALTKLLDRPEPAASTS